MAQDSEGRKYNRIPPHERKNADGSTSQVRGHVRSNRSDSKGKK